MLNRVVRGITVAGPWILAATMCVSPAAAGSPINPLPAPCQRRAALDPEQYKTLGRFLALGEGYRQWEQLDCYPSRLDDAALAAVDQPAGRVVSFGAGEAFVVSVEPAWFTRCSKTETPVQGGLPVDGRKLLALKQHLSELAAAHAVEIRELGFAEARMRDRRVLFALYLGTSDRNVYLECFEDLDIAVRSAFDALGAPRAKH